VRPLKDKTSATVIRVFKTILKEAKAVPVFLFSDQGSEFRSKDFMAFLKSKGIQPYSVYSHIKSSFAENFIRMLFQRIQRYMTYKKTSRLIDKLQNFVQSYNNTIHSVTKRRPNDITKEDEYFVWEQIFKKYLEEREKPRKPPKFHTNQLVRISRVKLLFEKGKKRENLFLETEFYIKN